MRGLVERLKTQKGIVIDHQTVPDANHFFEGRMDGLMEVVDGYLDKRLGKRKKPKEVGGVALALTVMAGLVIGGSATAALP